MARITRMRTGEGRGKREENHLLSPSLSSRGGSSLPTCRVRNRANPEGIPQQSPGLRAASYPGSTGSRRTNPNGVVCVGGERGHNPVGVERRFARYPRVARRLATLGWRTQSLWDCFQCDPGPPGPGPNRCWRTQSLWDCFQWHPGLVGNDKPEGEGGGQPSKGLAKEGEEAIFSHILAVPCWFSDALLQQKRPGLRRVFLCSGGTSYCATR